MRLAEALPDDPIAGLPLQVASAADWASCALREPLKLLEDHAHCELKAAATGFRLLGSYPEHGAIVDAMLTLVREEMRHFERVREELVKRGQTTLHKPRPDRYVRRLLEASRQGGEPLPRLVDKLLICALIEARSCERFRLLAHAHTSLSDFYTELALAEDRHHATFIELANVTHGEGVAQRLEALGRYEAEIVTSLPPEPRIH
jgi:tRNA 2-(methylsulfanyl)-N6-isopentenyladenosine37 hydroxylase